MVQAAARQPAVASERAVDESEGDRAERLVFERLRAALPPAYRLYRNVRWLGRTAPHRPVRDGEADIVVAHPEKGFLVIEVKAGEIARDASGRWWAGHNELDPSPFDQARTNMHVLLDKLRDLPDAPADFDPIAGHAVAFPDVDLASAGARLRLLGPDVDPVLVFDHAKLPPSDTGDPAADDQARTTTRSAIEAAFERWTGDGARGRAPGERGVALLNALLATPVELRSLLRSEIDEGEALVIRLTREQFATLREFQRVRRAAIRGGAGTGKTLLALEKARQLVRQGFRTLLVCFNQPLARFLREETEELAATGLLTVSTFHGLCEDLGREAGSLPQRPEPPPPDWWTKTLPDTLVEAIDRLGPRFQALVIDEGQDFEADWFEDLELLLTGGEDDVLYVFHDPAQSLYREDVVEQLGLVPFDLFYNCRNPQPIHELVARFAQGGLGEEALRTDGKPVEFIEVETPEETIEALRKLLHGLRHDEGVRPWEVAVLTGVSLEHSAVWRQRRFGNEVLWNGQVTDDGRPNGLPADKVEPQPSDAILCDSIRRFKGLERPVVILVELEPDDPRLEQLLYVGLSRARQCASLIARCAVPAELRKLGAGVSLFHQP